MTRECERPVKEFPFYSTRLAPIDWQAVIAEGQQWIDPNFKTQVSSLVDETMMRNNRITQWTTLTWKRPSEVYGEGNYVLYEEPGPNDIKQGKCGDCYFLSTLSSLAEYPDRIKKIFLTDETNAAGCYAVQVYINGEKQTVVVDDYFPYDTNQEQWAFSRPSKEDGANEIWVLVLEKVWAKIFGSYQRIESGTAGEAMYPLTGCPHQFFIHSNMKSQDKLWDNILYSDQQKFPMCTAVASQTDDDLTNANVKSVGLVDAHAYSLIGAKLITLDDKGNTERLVQVRNPWGKKEWQGAWSDKSEKWDDFTKRQVDLQDKDDGCFWISFADYVKFFYITTICYYYENHYDNFLADQHELQKFGMAKFTLDEDHTDPLTISIDQVNARFVDETMRGTYEYPALKLMLTKLRSVQNPTTQKEENQQLFLHGSRDADTHVSVPIKQGLKAGSYLLVY